MPGGLWEKTQRVTPNSAELRSRNNSIQCRYSAKCGLLMASVRAGPGSYDSDLKIYLGPRTPAPRLRGGRRSRLHNFIVSSSHWRSQAGKAWHPSYSCTPVDTSLTQAWLKLRNSNMIIICYLVHRPQHTHKTVSTHLSALHETVPRTSSLQAILILSVVSLS